MSNAKNTISEHSEKILITHKLQFVTQPIKS